MPWEPLNPSYICDDQADTGLLLLTQHGYIHIFCVSDFNGNKEVLKVKPVILNPLST